MKGTVIASAILLTIIIFCVSVSSYVSAFCDELITITETCSERAEENDTAGIMLALGKLSDKLDSNMHILEIFVDHRDLDSVENILAKLETAAQLGFRETIITECAYLVRQLENLSNSDKLTVRNVF